MSDISIESLTVLVDHSDSDLLMRCESVVSKVSESPSSDGQTNGQ